MCVSLHEHWTRAQMRPRLKLKHLPSASFICRRISDENRKTKKNREMFSQKTVLRVLSGDKKQKKKQKIIEKYCFATYSRTAFNYGCGQCLRSIFIWFSARHNLFYCVYRRASINPRQMLVTSMSKQKLIIQFEIENFQGKNAII